MERGSRDVRTCTSPTDAIRTTMSPTVRNLRLPLVTGRLTGKGPNTPVKSDVLATYLEGYDPKKSAYLISGFSEGFRIESEGLDQENLVRDNPQLPDHLRPVLEKKLQKEVDAGRIIGPFEEAPLPNIRVAPIKVAPKKTPGDYRFIHNLSYPYDEEAVNTSIPRDKVSVQYSTVDDAIRHIKEVGANAYLAKTDINPNPAKSARVVFPQSGHIRRKNSRFSKIFDIFPN